MSWFHESGLAVLLELTYFFSVLLNENILVFDKQSCFLFKKSSTFIKNKNNVNLKQWKKTKPKNKKSHSYVYVSETLVSFYPPDSYSDLSCLGKSMLMGLKAVSAGGLLSSSQMEAQETCLECISSHPSICLRQRVASIQLIQ